MYALNLSEDSRILSACVVLPSGSDCKNNPVYEIIDGKYNGMVVVEMIPDGNIVDYLYIDGEYIHRPLPKEHEIEPELTSDEVLNILLGVGGGA